MMNVADISARSLLSVEPSHGKRPMPPEQGPEWAPSAHSKGLFAAAAAAAFSCAAVMLMFQADRHVAMPRGQELGHAGAAASVGEPQELCRR